MKASEFFWEFDPAGTLASEPDVFFSNKYLRISKGQQLPAPRIYYREGRVIIIHGHPIAYGRRDDDSVLDVFNLSKDYSSCARELDGSFLILVHEPASVSLIVINDRFAAFALYFWSLGGRMVAGVSFRDVLLHARAHGGGAVDSDNVLAFLYLRRLLGEGTLARDIQYLRSGAMLSASSSGVGIEIYWQPDFQITPPRGRVLVEQLSEGLQSAVASHMSDIRRHGLMLSGGLDSRALLAAAPFPPECFTTCLTRNEEFQVAAEAARIAGAKHHFLQRLLTIHDDKLDEATGLAGMQVFNEAQFLGYGPQITPAADVVMVGLGFDIFFGGLYLPKVSASFVGREVLHYQLLPLPDDLAEFYLGNVKYRLKTSNPMLVITPEIRRTAYERLHAQAETIISRGKVLGANGYRLWEYMHLHNLSRHYSFPMLSSVRTFAECRAPALSNKLFDLAISMDVRDKLNGTPYQRAISKLAPRLMTLRNANTNLPAGWSLQQQTLAKVALFGLSFVGLTQKLRSPGWEERSWPLPRFQLDASSRLMEKVRALPECPTLATTGVIDLAGVKSVVAEHMAGMHDHAVLLNLLLTLSSILRPADRN
jgi:asparagine synthase (glutamine-hydrolysing)